jgi:hypothetical protein
MIDCWAIPQTMLTGRVGEVREAHLRRVAPTDPAFAGEELVVRASDHQGAVSDEAVERFRASLWATWGANRQTTDWPTTAQLRQALLAAVGGQ